MSEPKHTARAFYDSYNDQDLRSSFDSYVSPHLVNHVMGGSFDREAWLAFDSSMLAAFHDFSLEVLDQVAEGDKVATRYRLGGTQTSEFAGVTSRGNTAYLTGTSVDRVADGRIVEHWTDLDLNGFLTELGADASTTAEAAHALADEYFRLANAHDVDGLVALHAPDYVSHDRGGDTGIDDYRALITEFFAAFPDARLTPVNVVAEGDRLYVQFETTGTQQGTFYGMPATGRSVTFTEMRVRRIQDGKFAEHWGLLDEAVLFEPPAAAAGEQRAGAA